MTHDRAAKEGEGLVRECAEWLHLKMAAAQNLPYEDHDVCDECLEAAAEWIAAARATQRPQELEGLRKMSHKWVAEQAELGERTDNKQGLSEYRLDAAEQAFEAGWRAALTRGEVGR